MRAFLRTCSRSLRVGHASLTDSYYRPLIDQVTTMFSRDLTIARYDAELFAAMEQEAQRQEHHIELIASENYTLSLIHI